MELRDTTPKIAALSIHGNPTSIEIIGAPDTTYHCLHPADLANFAAIPTIPGTIRTGSSGRTTFTVENSGAKDFYFIEESP